MAKTNFQSGVASGLDMTKESDRLLAEVGRVILQAKRQPKLKAFGYLMAELSEPTLFRLLTSLQNSQKPKNETPANAAFLMMVIYLRSHLLGDKRGGFSATDDELLDITHTLEPYLVIELIRRRGCFEQFELPENPWNFNAVIRMRGPIREKLNATVTEFNTLKIPFPPLLTDDELLTQMEAEGIGVELPMPVRGRPTAAEVMVNVKFQKLPELDPIKFEQAMREVNETAFSTEPLKGFESFSQIPEIDFVRRNGSVQRMGGDYTPEPLLRAIHIFGRHFDENYEEAQSAFARFFALTEMMRNDSLPNYMTATPQGVSIHPAVIVASANVKLTPTGTFPPALFASKVETLANGAAKRK